MTVTMTSEITVDRIAFTASDQMVAAAARVSTLGERAADDPTRPLAPLIRRLVADQHGSPFEHTFFTFRVHAPLYVMTEHLRHRAGWSYNGESGRYKTFEPVFYTPPPERGVTQVGRAMDYDVQAGTDTQRETVAAEVGHASQAAWFQFLIVAPPTSIRPSSRKIVSRSTAPPSSAAAMVRIL